MPSRIAHEVIRASHGANFAAAQAASSPRAAGSTISSMSSSCSIGVPRLHACASAGADRQRI
jgi:hypothetical protein